MKIFIFTHEPISHILPLKNFLEELGKKAELFCYCYQKNQVFFDNLGIKTFIYPTNILNADIKAIIDENNSLMSSAYKEEDYMQFYDCFLKEDIISIHRLDMGVMQECLKVVKKACPDLILRDSVDQVGRLIAEKLSIKTAGFITNPIYNFTLFETDPLHYYAYFLNFFSNLLNDSDYDCFSTSFLQNAKKYLFDLYKYTENEYKLYPLYPYHHYDPNESINIIFSLPEFQPKQAFDPYKLYAIIPPITNNFKIEDSIPQSLKDFIADSRSVCYISTGSFVNIKMEKYIEIIHSLISENMNIIISCKEMENKIKTFIDSAGYTKKVYLSKFLPQNYVLKNSDLFVTIGGMNSINEAVFYEVPMVVCPITAEQVFNGLTIDKLNIGRTTYSKEILREKKSFHDVIVEVINSSIFGVNLEKLKNEMLKYNQEDNFIKAVNLLLSLNKLEAPNE